MFDLDNMTEFGGENILNRSFDSDEGRPINIFESIKNQTAQKNFKRGVKRSSIVMDIANLTKKKLVPNENLD